MNSVFSHTVKKSEAKKFVVAQRNMTGIFLIVFAIWLVGMQYFITPTIIDAYIALKIPVPYLTRIFPYITIVTLVFSGIMAVALLLVKPTQEEIDEILAGHNEEGIPADALKDIRYTVAEVLMAVVFMAFVISSIILPLYQITSKLGS